MKNYKVRSVANGQRKQFRKRVKKTHSRAKFVGFLYLVGTIVLTALAAMPLLATDVVKLGAADFWTVFTEEEASMTAMIAAGLYGAMFLGLVINVFKALSKLNWLYARTASRTYGLNRNVYAMNELGRVFSGTFASILNFHFLIYLVVGTATVDQMMLIVAIAGAVIHLLGGIWGGKASLFQVGPMGLVEEKREIGRFAPFVRNVLQLVVSCALIETFVALSTISSFVAADDMVTAITNDVVGFAIQAVIVISVLVLVKHATNTTEYSLEGRLAPGMKNFRVFTFFTAAASAGAIAMELAGDYTMMAVIAGAMFVIEIIMRKAPRFPEEKVKEEEEEEAPAAGMNAPNAPAAQNQINLGDNITLDDYFNQYYIKEGVILNNMNHPQYPQYPNYYVNSMPNDWGYMQ